MAVQEWASGPSSRGPRSRGAPLPEDVLVQPGPDRIAVGPDGDPADVVVARKGVRLAFIAALQHLPRANAPCLCSGTSCGGSPKK